jgi:pilus assembly protein Flp/PilA
MPDARGIVKIVGKLTRSLQSKFCFCMGLSTKWGGLLEVCAPLSRCERSRAVRDLIGLGLRLLKNDSGATAIEYAIIACTLSIVIVTAVTAIGTSVNEMFNSVQAGFE